MDIVLEMRRGGTKTLIVELPSLICIVQAKGTEEKLE